MYAHPMMQALFRQLERNDYAIFIHYVTPQFEEASLLGRMSVHVRCTNAYVADKLTLACNVIEYNPENALRAHI